MKYEYKVLEKIPGTDIDFSLEDINELGEKGWKVVTFIVKDNGYEFVLLERMFGLNSVYETLKLI